MTVPDEGDVVTYEVRDGVAVVTLNRPDYRNWIHQHLVAQTVAQFEGDEGGEVAACRVAADRDLVRVAAELSGVVEHPPCRRDAVVERGWGLVLRSEPIVERYHDAPRAGRKVASGRLRFQRAPDHEAATMDPHEHRERAVASRRHHQCGHASDLALGERGDGSTLAGECHQPLEQLPRLGWRQLLERLLPVYLETELYRALLESAASEHGARRTAMRNASKNAGELIDRLTLDMNRARQAEITQEILEVVAGADALE